MDRRELLGSLASSFKGKNIESGQESLIRPPYNKNESLFYSKCKDCDGKCATVCEEEIIKIAEDKTPYLSFEKSGCTFCDECVKACEYDVLLLQDRSDIDAIINIDVSSCLSWSEVMCFSCKDPCLENAIEFQAMFKPVIDESKCTSCGFCISRCPVDAIKIGSL